YASYEEVTYEAYGPGGAEPGVAGGVAAALLGGDRDLADQLGEQRAAPLVGDGFLPLDLLPLAVASHSSNLQRSPIRVEHAFDPHPAPVEVQIDEAGRPVAVLQDDQLGRPVHPVSRVVHLLPVEPEHHVGMLLDRA